MLITVEQRLPSQELPDKRAQFVMRHLDDVRKLEAGSHPEYHPAIQAALAGDIGAVRDVCARLWHKVRR